MASLALASCANKPPPPPPKPSVAAAYPLQRTITDWDDYIGRFEAIQDVQVMPRVAGTIQRVDFREGIEVKRGQVLFVIDQAPYRAALAQAAADEAKASAAVANGRTELARARTLLAGQAISQEEYETKLANYRSAVAGLAGARAAVKSRQLDLDYTVVRAPITGRASDKRVAIGDFVAAGTTLLTRIVSTDPIWFSFDGAESFYLKYSRQAQDGQRASSRYAPNPVDIQLADEQDYRWHGRMVFVDNAIDPQSGTIRAHAEVSNPNGFLVPGMFGRARLLGSGSYDAMLIPDEAIQTDQTRRTVFVVGPDGKTAQRNVETGPLVSGLRVVKTGVGTRDRVVIDGLTQLQPGIAVTVRLVKLTPRAADTSSNATTLSAPAPAEATTR
ncbi:efflux RND transporter periplasmic adaptor subunit [uncultured Sphingomonas sp.]|uniref:efflux RND transporter periplasmic adaptor subunit n=1 Tax=uncultured Sphingomonas sp. TaxID=158754 RepID=UPI0035CB52FD